MVLSPLLFNKSAFCDSVAISSPSLSYLRCPTKGQILIYLTVKVNGLVGRLMPAPSCNGTTHNTIMLVSNCLFYSASTEKVISANARYRQFQILRYPE